MNKVRNKKITWAKDNEKIKPTHDDDLYDIEKEFIEFSAEQDRYQSAISYKNYLYDYIIEAGIFNKENYGLLYDYIVYGNTVFNESVLLTAEEKHKLGLNTRQKIPMGLLMFFDSTKLRGLDVKREIKNVYYRALAKARLIMDCENAKKLGIKEVMYRCCNDERDCEWCKGHNGKFFIVHDDPVGYVLKNCKCEYNRSFFQCVIPENDPDCLVEVKLKDGL